MKTILEAATTWTIASVLTATLMAQVVEVSLAPFQTINERMAEALGRAKPQAKKHPTLQTLFADFDWSSNGDPDGTAVALSKRFRQMMAITADE